VPKPNLNDYITVAERLIAFYEKHPEGSIRAEILSDDGKRVVMKAYAYRTPQDEHPGIGHAEEVRGEGMVNKTSALENCETSSWGRAIASLGFHVQKGVASREEVEQAQAEQERQNGLSPDDKLRERIKALGVVDESRAKLTEMGVTNLDGLSPEQREEFEGWLTTA
jgi:hypothetical protein